MNLCSQWNYYLQMGFFCNYQIWPLISIQSSCQPFVRYEDIVREYPRYPDIYDIDVTDLNANMIVVSQFPLFLLGDCAMLQMLKLKSAENRRGGGGGGRGSWWYSPWNWMGVCRCRFSSVHRNYDNTTSYHVFLRKLANLWSFIIPKSLKFDKKCATYQFTNTV